MAAVGVIVPCNNVFILLFVILPLHFLVPPVGVLPSLLWAQTVKLNESAIIKRTVRFIISLPPYIRLQVGVSSK